MATINQIQVNGTIYDIEVDSANVSGTVATATTATKLGTADKGSATQPIYLNAGIPTATTYTLGKSVPSDAKFTDTTYTAFAGATSSAAGAAGLVPQPTAGQEAAFLRGDGTWAAVNVNLIYIGTTQPAANTGYLLWINTSTKVLYYREDPTTTTWLQVASVWS